MATLQSNGSWPDVNYAYSATTYTADVHINRVKTFALAYTKSASSYYKSATLFTAIVNSLTYWNHRRSAKAGTGTITISPIRSASAKS